MAIIDSLESFWPLEADANDAHGSNHLTNSGVTFPAGGVGGQNAADFEAADLNDQCFITDNASLSGVDVDFEFNGFVQFESLPGSGATIILAKDDWAAFVDREYLLYVDGDASNRVTFAVVGSPAATTVATTTFGGVTTGTWYFFRGWHKASNDTLGVSIDLIENSTPTLGAPANGGKNFVLGNTQDSVAPRLDGRLQRIGFWKGRVLASDEIAWLRNSGSGRSYAEIVAGMPTGQFARPTSDVAAGTWTPSAGSDLYAMVDETSANDSDYMRSAMSPVNDVAKLGLSALGTPGAGTVTLRVRHRRTP